MKIAESRGLFLCLIVMYQNWDNVHVSFQVRSNGPNLTHAYFVQWVCQRHFSKQKLFPKEVLDAKFSKHAL